MFASSRSLRLPSSLVRHRRLGGPRRRRRRAAPRRCRPPRTSRSSCPTTTSRSRPPSCSPTSSPTATTPARDPGLRARGRRRARPQRTRPRSARIAEELGPKLGHGDVRPAGRHDRPRRASRTVSEDGPVAVGDDRPRRGVDRVRHPGDRRRRDLRDDLEPLVEGTGLTVRPPARCPRAWTPRRTPARRPSPSSASPPIVLIVVLLALIFRSVIICLMPIARGLPGLARSPPA